jgi:UDP-N-acetylmuramoyl-tripeptide--D-alanyl-D-alanine ligase
MKPAEVRRALRRVVPSSHDGWSALLRTAKGRRELRSLLRSASWPLLRPLAWLHRRALARRRTVVAVTGTFGKTTTARAIAAALGVDRVPGANFRAALALGLLRAGPHGRPLTFEVGISRPHQMAAYAGMLRPEVAVVTSIGEEHLAAMGSLEATAREKGRLVESLRPGGLVVVNGDDARTLEIAERRPAGVERLRVGWDDGNDYRATDLRLDWPSGSRFRLRGPGSQTEIEVRAQLLGRHQVRGLLAAWAVALFFGEHPETVRARLEALAPTPGRLSRHRHRSGAWLLRDDTKGALSTMRAAFEVFAEVPARRRVLVLSDVAEPEESTNSLYRKLGGEAAAIADRILFIGRKFDRLRVGATAAGLDRSRVTRHGSAAEVAATLEDEIGDGDVVLIKGGRRRSGFHDIARLLLGDGA